MKNNKIIDFKYHGTYIFNIVSFMFFILFLLIIYIILSSVNTFETRIIFILLSTIFILIWMLFIGKKLCTLNGRFVFDKDEFTYYTLRKTYTIKYTEIEYISKENYTDYSNIFNVQKVLYRLKIKNNGSFTFAYIDNSLLDALSTLSQISKVKIDDLYN